MSEVTESERNEVLKLSELPGRTVAMLSELGGVKDSLTKLIPTVPHSMLPLAITDQTRWVDSESGR